MSEDLFGGLIGSPTTAATATTGGSLADANRAEDGEHSGLPLPVRMRPRTLDEIVGQQHLLAPGSPLRRLATGEPMSVFLWGPPGVGKTTIASVVSAADRLEVRRDLRGDRRGQGRPRGARPGAARSADRSADRAVRGRGAPVLQDPAGRAAAGRGEPARHPDRGDHREPVASRSSPRCCRAPCCSPCGRSPTTTSPVCWTAPWPTTADCAGRTRWTTTPGPTCCDSPVATPVGP